MPRRSSRSGRRALLALLFCAAGCEALVDGQLGTVHCLAEGMLGPPGCPTGYACTGGLCVPTELGAPCHTDADCALSDFCFDPTVFGAAGPARCSRACCSSGDCDPDRQFVCAITPSGGGNVCRLASELGRPSGGAGQPLDSCAEDGDCRSGRCLDHRCLDTCCTDTPCAVGAVSAADAGDESPSAPAGACRFGQPSPAEAFGFWCAAPAPLPASPGYIECSSDSSCASGLCASFGDMGSFCAPPCCSSRDCDDLAPGIPVRCVTVPGPNPVRACAAIATAPASEDVGLPCSTDADCRSGICLEQAGRYICSDACCLDESCGDTEKLGCRPINSGGGWALQCVLK